MITKLTQMYVDYVDIYDPDVLNKRGEPSCVAVCVPRSYATTWWEKYCKNKREENQLTFNFNS